MDAAQAPKKAPMLERAPMLADFAGIQDKDERGRMQVELYKLRAEEYRDRYQDARSVEWNTLFQVYAAYAGLAIAFKYVFEQEGKTHPKLICLLAIAATTVFYAVSRYLNYRVQERLLIFDTTRENYVHQLDAAFHIPEANPGRKVLGDRYFWTFRTHLILSTFTFTILLGYEISKALITNPFPLLICLFLIGCALLEIGLICVPKLPVNRIWYASYGSNLSYQKRFMCYIAGGRPEGSQKINPGCRDKTPPIDNKAIPVPFELYFAEYSDLWGGGVAFVKRSRKSANTLGRMYLITEDQFNDVVLQENSRLVNGQRVLPPLEQMVEQSEFLLPDIKMYGRLLSLGNQDGYPIFTFTNSSDDLETRAPSEAYVKIIIRGIKESYPTMTTGEIGKYLLDLDGIQNQISSEEIKRWIEEVR